MKGGRKPSRVRAKPKGGSRLPTHAGKVKAHRRKPEWFKADTPIRRSWMSNEGKKKAAQDRKGSHRQPQKGGAFEENSGISADRAVRNPRAIGKG